MTAIRKVALQVGIVGGVLGFLHALIPGSRAYPLIWPALAGAVAFWLASADDAPGRVRRGMFAAGSAGLIVGVIGFIGSSITVLATSRRAWNPMAEALGSAGPPLALSAAVLACLVAALVFVGVTILAGAVMIPIRLAASRSHAPSA